MNGFNLIKLFNKIIHFTENHGHLINYFAEDRVQSHQEHAAIIDEKAGVETMVKVADVGAEV